MIRFYFTKLVRDNIVQSCLDDPKVLATEYRVLDDESYYRELLNKVAEEAEEIPNARLSSEALEELADLQSVVDALRERLGFSEAQIRRAVAEKEAKKGRFNQRHYIHYVDLAPDSEWVTRLRAQPDKYSEEVIGE